MKPRVRLNKEWRPDVLFMGGALSSVLFICAQGRHFDEWCFMVPIIPVCLFSVPLCRTFRRGILRAREAVQEQTERSPWKTFWHVLWPHIALWVATFAVYVVLLERHFFRAGGLGQAIISAPTVGLTLLMFATCFLWAPACEKSWALALLSLFTPLLLGILLGGGSMFLVAPLGMEGYMGLGYVIVPPLITSVGLLIGALAILVCAWRKGDAWFQPRTK